ncbi:hypothetical protein Tco_0621587 [Tanacetum coccineum]
MLPLLRSLKLLRGAINIAQRLMDQVTKHTPMQVSSDHKRKFDDRRTFNNYRNNNNYRNTNTNNHHNNSQPQQKNEGKKLSKGYAATPAENIMKKSDEKRLEDIHRS